MTEDLIACHEAGHAVGSFIARRAIQTVSIRGDGKSYGGYISHPVRPHQVYRKVRGMDAWTLNKPRRMGPKKLQKAIDILLSGAAAEIAHMGGLFPWASDRDFDGAVAHAEELADRYRLPPAAETRPIAKLFRNLVMKRELSCAAPIVAFLDWRLGRAVINMRSFEPAIELLVEELLRCQRISGHKAKAIIKSTQDANADHRAADGLR